MSVPAARCGGGSRAGSRRRRRRHTSDAVCASVASPDAQGTCQVSADGVRRIWVGTSQGGGFTGAVAACELGSCRPRATCHGRRRGDAAGGRRRRRHGRDCARSRGVTDPCKLRAGDMRAGVRNAVLVRNHRGRADQRHSRAAGDKSGDAGGLPVAAVESGGSWQRELGVARHRSDNWHGAGRRGAGPAGSGA